MDKLQNGQPRRLDPLQRRLRARLNGEWLFDTLEGCLFYERGQHPVYAIPLELLDVDAMVLAENGRKNSDGCWWTWAHRPADALIRTWPSVPLDLPALQRFATVEMGIADAWFEEDKEVFYKPRDPFRRVEVFESSRELSIEIVGVVVAQTNRPYLVMENGMPEQWYLPRADINWTFLSHSDHQSYCQYKGKARYWDVDVNGKHYESLAWSYQETVVEASAMSGLVGFPRMDETVKTYVDGKLLPQTTYSPDWHSPSMAL